MEYTNFKAAAAKALGLENLHRGTHILRDHRGWRDDEIWVDYVWQAFVLPSFDPPAMMAFVRTRESVFRGKQHPRTQKGVMCLCDGSDNSNVTCFIADNIEDTITSLFQSINLVPDNQQISIDGIGYLFDFSGAEISSTVNIRTPCYPLFRNIEATLFSFADAIFHSSKDKRLKQYLE